MKRFILITAITVFALAGSNLRAQENKDAGKEREIDKVIIEQKRAMNDKKKDAEDDEEYDIRIDHDQIREQMRQVDEQMREAEEEMRNSGVNNFHWNGRAFSFEIPDVPMPPDAPDARVFVHSFGDGERTTWDFSKSVKENTFSRDYAFDVEKSAKTVVMSVMGDCKGGEIKITIEMPNGKNYSEIVLDEFGNLNWRKSFNISEDENQDKTGEWKFRISSKKATGYFKISLQTY